MDTTMSAVAAVRRPPVRPAVRKPREKVVPPTLAAPPGLYDPSRILAKSNRSRSYCGPWVAMAVTGLGFEEVRAGANIERGRQITDAIKGLSTGALRWFLEKAGVPIVRRTEYHTMMQVKGQTLTLRRFLKARQGEDRTRTFIIVAGNHFTLVRGRKVTCAILGRWTWIKHIKKAKAPVETILQIGERRKEKTRQTREALRTKLKAVKTMQRALRSTKNSTYWKRIAEAEMKRLDITCDVDRGRTRDDRWTEVRIYCPDDYWFRETCEQGWFHDDWQSVAEALRGKTAEELFEEAT